MAEYRQMLAQHESVLADADRLELLVDEPPSDLSSERLRELLLNDAGVLRDDLARHFAYEEEGGYLRVVLEARPGLEHRVAALRDDHREMMRRLGEVSATRGPDLERLRGQLRELLALLRAHEAAETELVHSTVNLDMGAPD